MGSLPDQRCQFREHTESLQILQSAKNKTFQDASLLPPSPAPARAAHNHLNPIVGLLAPWSAQISTATLDRLMVAPHPTAA
jgi:hypothetical protein